MGETLLPVPDGAERNVRVGGREHITSVEPEAQSEFVPVVRVVPVQPISVEQFGVELAAWDAGNAESIAEFPPLTRAFFIQKNQSARNAGQIMAAGGKLQESERKNSNIAQAAAREIQKELHIHLIGGRQSVPLINRSRQYTFTSDDGAFYRQEYWSGVVVPSQTYPYVFYPETDRIARVIALSPSEVTDLLREEKLPEEYGPSALIDNLLSDEQTRLIRRVAAEQEEIDDIKDGIGRFVHTQENDFRMRLIQYIYDGLPQNKSLLRDHYYMRALQVFEDDSADFAPAFYAFIAQAQQLYIDSVAGRSFKEFKDFLRASWAAVLFAERVDNYSKAGLQGKILAAQLPFERLNEGMYRKLTEDAQSPLGRFMKFVTKALDPGSSGAVDSAQALYQRLDHFQKIMVEGSEDDRNRWRAHVRRAYLSFVRESVSGNGADKITDTDVEQGMQAYNEFLDDVLENAQEAIDDPQLETELKATENSYIGQLEELVLLSFGRNQYITNDARARRLGLRTSKRFFEARRKLLNIEPIIQYKLSYGERNNASTYPWRRLLMEQLFVEEVSTDHISELTGATDRWETYKTKFELHGVPIYNSRIIRDKTFTSYYRKALERNWEPERINDTFGETIVIDTGHPLAQEALKQGYEKYKEQYSNAWHLPEKQWVARWEKRVPIHQLRQMRDAHTQHRGALRAVELKDSIRTHQHDGSSAASALSVSMIKGYVIHHGTKNSVVENDGKNTERFALELMMFPGWDAYLTKKRDDPRYARDRYRRSRTGNVPLFMLLLPPEFHPRVYQHLIRGSQAQAT